MVTSINNNAMPPVMNICLGGFLFSQMAQQRVEAEYNAYTALINELYGNPENLDGMYFRDGRRVTSNYIPSDNSPSTRRLCCLVEETESYEGKYRKTGGAAGRRCFSTFYGIDGGSDDGNLVYVSTQQNDRFEVKIVRVSGGGISNLAANYSTQIPKAASMIYENLGRRGEYRGIKSCFESVAQKPAQYLEFDTYTNDVIVTSLLNHELSKDNRLSDYLDNIQRPTTDANTTAAICNPYQERKWYGRGTYTTYGLLVRSYCPISVLDPKDMLRFKNTYMHTDPKPGGTSYPVFGQHVVHSLVAQVYFFSKALYRRFQFCHGNLIPDNVAVCVIQRDQQGRNQRRTIEGVTIDYRFSARIKNFDHASITYNTRNGAPTRIYNSSFTSRSYLKLRPFVPNATTFGGVTYYYFDTSFKKTIRMHAQHSPLPYYPSFDVYTFVIGLCHYREFFRPMMEEPLYSTIWRGLWPQEGQEKRVAKRLEEVIQKGIKPTMDSVLDVLTGMYLRCDLSGEARVQATNLERNLRQASMQREDFRGLSEFQARPPAGGSAAPVPDETMRRTGGAVPTPPRTGYEDVNQEQADTSSESDPLAEMRRQTGF